MPISSIEIICLPCTKCAQLKPKIDEIIKSIEIQTKTKIVYQFTHTPNLKDISKYSLNPSQTPIVVINGKVEMAGQVNPMLLKNKLESVNRF